LKIILIAVVWVVLASLPTVGMASAQSGELTLHLSRDFGYGGFNGDIQGLFSMRVTGPADLARVEFYIDSTKIGKLDKAPFNLQFKTDDYSLGIRQLSAIGYSSSGQVYRSNIISSNFVPPQSSTKFLLPVLGVVLAALLLSALVPFLTGRSKHTRLPLGSERTYGVGGGGICPKCHRPFALSVFSVHLGFSKLAACPYCGKWSLVRLESIEKLRQAEEAELAIAQPLEKVAGETEEEKLRKELDESKYND
jgi:hypothetical protein